MARQDTRQAMAPVGARIRQAQQAKGLTNRVLAERVGVGERLLLKWKAGQMPSYSNLARLAEVLDRPVAWFFTADGDEPAAAA